MKLRWLITGAFIIAGIAAFLIFRQSETPQVADNQSPEVLNVRNFQVTIAWISERPYKGKVYYRTAGIETSWLSAEETVSKTTRHEVVIRGLEPSSRYTYRIDNSERQYQFQTQPLPNMMFSFLMVYGDVSDRIVPLLMSEIPEFVLSLTSEDKDGPDRFAPVRPYVPIYGTEGSDSPFLRAIDAKLRSGSDNSWNLDWGGLRLIFLRSANLSPNLLNAPSVHTFGIIATDENIPGFRSGETADKSVILESPLHSAMISHNRKHPSSPIAFVSVIGKQNEVIEADGIRYVGIPALQNTGRSGSIRIDVDVDSVRAAFVDEGKEIVLRSPPLRKEITCGECRRLADKGAYQKSVKAYKSFIEHNQGHYQVDDACYAIAEILDEKLFMFDEALKWYNRLVKEYPNGTLTPLAKQRIRYLSEYSDHNFEPLIRFERIKMVELSRKKGRKAERIRLLKDVESLISEYPESKLAPVMQYWVANQYRGINPDQAVQSYMKLKQTHPDHPEANEVMIEIGETYYDAGRYQESLKAYQKALVELPESEKTIMAQISRCRRNMRRNHIAYGCWVILILMTILSMLRRETVIGARMMIIASAMFLILGFILFFGAWMIHEQFSSFREMVLIVAFISAAAVFSAIISVTLRELYAAKLIYQENLFGKTIVLISGFISGIIAFVSGLYLIIYYINVHYLIIISL